MADYRFTYNGNDYRLTDSEAFVDGCALHLSPSQLERAWELKSVDLYPDAQDCDLGDEINESGLENHILIMLPCGTIVTLEQHEEWQIKCSYNKNHVRWERMQNIYL